MWAIWELKSDRERERESLCGWLEKFVWWARLYVGDWKSLYHDRDSIWEIGRACVMRDSLCGRLELEELVWWERVYVGDCKSSCDERESMWEIGAHESYVGNWSDERKSMWAIGRGCVMRVVYVGNWSDEREAMWVIGAHGSYVGDWSDEREREAMWLCGWLELMEARWAIGVMR